MRVTSRNYGRAGSRLTKKKSMPIPRMWTDTGKVPLVHEGGEAGVVLSGRLEVTVDRASNSWTG